MKRNPQFFTCLIAAICIPMTFSSAQEDPEKTGDTTASAMQQAETEPDKASGSAPTGTIETIAGELKNPVGLAIQPDSGTLFIADSGHQRVIRVVDGKVEEVIKGFAAGTATEGGSSLSMGPLSLLFLDNNTLVVGEGGAAAGEDKVMVFNVPEPGAEPLDATKDRRLAESLPADGEMAAEGDFLTMAATNDWVYVISNGDDAKGWIARLKRNGNELGSMERFLPAGELAGATGPMALAISPGNRLAIGHIGARDIAGDSKLSFFNQTGTMETVYTTGINDLIALAYSPGRKRMFALDFNFGVPDGGGLFKLVATDKDGVCEARPLPVPGLVRPTAMVFDAAGNLYVSQCGSPSEDEAAATGSVVRIKGLDVAPTPPANVEDDE